MLECLEDCIKAEIVANRETLTINKASDPSFKEIPTDREDFYIHLADYFDVVAGRDFPTLYENASDSQLFDLLTSAPKPLFAELTHRYKAAFNLEDTNLSILHNIENSQAFTDPGTGKIASTNRNLPFRHRICALL